MKKVITKKVKAPTERSKDTTVTVATTVKATKDELDGLKKAKSLATKAMVKAAATVRNTQASIVSEQSVKKTVKKVDVTAKPVVSESVSTVIKPVSLSRDPGGLSAATFRESPKTTEFDPLKKPAFIQPVTLSGRPLPGKQFNN